jgi:hypothetical protein
VTNPCFCGFGGPFLLFVSTTKKHQKVSQSQAPVLMPVIPATQEAEIRRITV